MMKRTLMIGVAAGALLAGVNIASAQGMNQQQPSASGGASAQGGASMEQKGGAETKGRASGGAQLNANEPGAKSRAQAPDAKAPDTKAMDNKAQDQKGQRAQDTKGQDKDQMKSTTGQAQDQKGQDQKGQRAQDTQKDSTKGQAAESGKAQGDTKASASGGGNKAANLSTEQKTKIRETVIRSSNAPRVTNVNFSLNIGTVVPSSVRFAPLPSVLVEVFPEWRGFDYIIVEDRIVILEPRTHKIVTILVV